MSFILLFSPPELGQIELGLWLFTFALLTRVTMSFYHVPHTALGAELTNDFAERTTVVAYRQFFSTFGGLLTYAIGFGLFFQATPEVAHGQFRVEQYTPFAICISLVMMASVFLSAWGTQAYVPFLPQPMAAPSRVSALGSMVRTYREVRDALRNRSFAWLFVGVLVVFMMVGVDNVLNLHINTYFWELSSRGNLLFFAATPIGVMVGSMFARRINDRFDKKPSVVFGTSWWAFCQIMPIVLRLLGWFPENGSDTLLWTLVGVKFLQGAGVAQALITFGSMIADIVDEHELGTGKRQEGVFFAAAAFSGKVTTGVGGVIAGFALTLISWPSGPGIRTAADVPPDTLMWLGLLYGPIVSGFVVVSVWCYSKHHLDRARHAEILRELELRRQNAADANARPASIARFA